VYIATYRYSGNRFTWFEVSGTGGIRSTGARGNKFTWFEVSGTGGFRCIHIDTVETGSPGLKYPVPEDSGLQI